MRRAHAGSLPRPPPHLRPTAAPLASFLLTRYARSLAAAALECVLGALACALPPPDPRRGHAKASSLAQPVAGPVLLLGLLLGSKGGVAGLAARTGLGVAVRLSAFLLASAAGGAVSLLVVRGCKQKPLFI